MKNKTGAILQPMIAALLISGAAICAAAQADLPKKENVRTNPPNPESQQKEESSRSPAAGVSDANNQTRSDVKVRSARFSYEFKQPNFLIARIFIEHDQNGVGTVTFERKNNDPIVDPLDLSSTTIARVKTLWEALHFLDSDKSYQTEKQYPHLGTTRLHMKQDARDRIAEFNWTIDRDAFALATEYRRIANQAIFIFDIALAREIQPLDAPKLMDQFDDYVRRDELADPKQLIPLLRDLSTDERIPLIARNHAARLLKKIEK